MDHIWCNRWMDCKHDYGKGCQMGALANIIVGIVGAMLGGFIMNAFGAQGVTGFNLTSLIVAILGAVVLLFLASMVRRV